MASILMRVTRASMLEVLKQDYITFAEAKGLSRGRILVKHALKNALIPTVTVAAIETGSLLGGNMVVETVFGWPGLGRLVVRSEEHTSELPSLMRISYPVFCLQNKHTHTI